MTDEPRLNVDPKMPNSWLAQKLQRRVVESAGVIEVRRLPVAKTFTTISRMVERQSLPTQIQSRYQTVGTVQPFSLTGRSRVESLDSGTPSLNMASSLGMLQQSPDPLMATAPVVPFSAWSPDAPAAIAAQPTGTFRVSRKIIPDSSGEAMTASPVAESIHASPVSADLQMPVASESATGSASESATGSEPRSPLESVPGSEPMALPERVRVQAPHAQVILHQTMPEMGLVIAKHPSTPTAETQTTDAGETGSAPVTYPVTHPVPDQSPHSAAAPVTDQGSETSPATSDRPLVDRSMDFQGNPPANPATSIMGSAAAIAAEGGTTSSMPLVIARMPAISDLAPTTAIARSMPSPPLANAQRVEQFPAGSSGSRAVVLQPKSLTSPQALATLPVGPLPFLSPGKTATTPLRVAPNLAESTLQLSPEPGMRPWGGGSFLTGGEIARSPLPLYAHRAGDLIARQPDPPAISESPPAPAIPAPAPAAESPAAPNVDVKQLAEQVSRLLMRQLTVERERRGRSSW